MSESPAGAAFEAAVAAAVGPAVTAPAPTVTAAPDTDAAAAADDVIVEEEATLEAGRAKGLLSCARCGLRPEHGVHVPRLLPACLHTLCSLCAAPEHSGLEGGEVRCALCRTVSPATVSHPLLEGMLRQTHEQQRATDCGQCAERGGRATAAGTCADCQTDLCRDCIQAHKITRATWAHKLEMMPETEQEDMCPVHHQVYDNYCNSCEALCCRDCILSAHRSHQSCTLETKLAETRLDIHLGLEGVRDVKTKLDQNINELKVKLSEFEKEKTRSMEGIHNFYEKYQSEIRGFFVSQVESCRRRHDVHSGEVLERLQAASLVDARAAHLDNLVGRLLDSRRADTSVHYSRHIFSLCQRLLSVDLPEAELEKPELSLRRVLGVDRIRNLISVLLYEGNTCLQPRTKRLLCHEFMTSVQALIGAQLRSDTDFGITCVRLLFRLIGGSGSDGDGGSVAPQMRALVDELHHIVVDSFQEVPSSGPSAAPLQRHGDLHTRSWLLRYCLQNGQMERPPEEQREGAHSGQQEFDLDEPLVLWSSSGAGGPTASTASGAGPTASSASGAGPTAPTASGVGPIAPSVSGAVGPTAPSASGVESVARTAPAAGAAPVLNTWAPLSQLPTATQENTQRLFHPAVHVPSAPATTAAAVSSQPATPTTSGTSATTQAPSLLVSALRSPGPRWISSLVPVAPQVPAPAAAVFAVPAAAVVVTPPAPTWHYVSGAVVVPAASAPLGATVATMQQPSAQAVPPRTESAASAAATTAPATATATATATAPRFGATRQPAPAATSAPSRPPVSSAPQVPREIIPQGSIIVRMPQIISTAAVEGSPPASPPAEHTDTHTYTEHGSPTEDADPAAAGSLSDSETDDGLFIDTKVDVMETALAMVAEQSVSAPAAVAPAGLSSARTKPAPIPAGHAAPKPAPPSAAAETKSATVPAGNPAWKVALREKVQRTMEKARARRAAPASAGVNPVKKLKMADAAPAGRGKPGPKKRKKKNERGDVEPPPKIGRDGFTARDDQPEGAGEANHHSASSSPAAGRRVEDTSANERQRKDGANRGRAERDRRETRGKDGRATSPTPAPQPAQDRAPPAAPPRSLLVDDHGRKVSKAGVSVDTSLTDLLDSMLLGGGPATAAAKGLPGRPAPPGSDKFVLAHCAPRGESQRPPRAPGVQLAVEEPTERASERPSQPSQPTERASERASQPTERVSERPSQPSQPAAAAGPSGTDRRPQLDRQISRALISDLALSDDSSGASGAGSAASNPSRPSSSSSSSGGSSSSSGGSSSAGSSSSSSAGSSSSSGTSTPSSVAARDSPELAPLRPPAHRPRPSTSTLVRALPEFATTPPPTAVRPKFSPPHRVSPAHQQVRPSPAPKRVQSPSHRVSPAPKRVESPSHRASPAPKRVQSPSHRVSPAPKRVESPSNRASAKPKRAKSPSNRVSPAPKRVESPSNRASAKPKRAKSPSHRVSPAPKRVQSPSHRASPALKRVQSPSNRVSPAPKRVQSPSNRASPAPKRVHSPSHRPSTAPKRVKSPSNRPLTAPKREKSPSNRPSTAPKRVQSPSNRASPAPKRVQSPSNRASPAPERVRSPSPPHGASPAPHRIRSPPHRASLAPKRFRSPSPPPAPPPAEAAAVVPVPTHLVRPADAARWDRQRDPLGIGFASEALYRPPDRGPGSPNISYCVLCWDGGDLLLCDQCERAFHAECYIGDVEDDDNGQWQCLMCQPVPRVPGPDERRRGPGLTSAEMRLAQRLLLEMYSAYYPCLYFKNQENMSMLPGYARIQNPVCLDEIRDCLVNDGFPTLMDLLAAIRGITELVRILEKGSAARKYLKELEEVFDTFVRDNINQHWLQLDDGE